MKIGFDYWNVISHYPEQFRELLSSFANNANDVYYISAIGKGRQGTIAKEIHALWPGIRLSYFEEYTHEVVFKHPRESPTLKLAKCQELGIEMFFDDRQDVCDLLNANGILCFKVPRAGGDVEKERK